MPRDTLNILFVDDDDAFRLSALEDLISSLGENGIQSRIEALTDISQGIQQLQSGNFHLAIVDLRFDSANRSGNEIIEVILAEKILPIIVLSGFSGDLREDFAQHGLIYNTQRKRVEEVVDKIVEWDQRQVFDFFSDTGFLTSKLRDVLQQTMWNHVSRYWKNIDSADPQILERIIGRIAATLLYDVLASTPTYQNGGDEILVHHGEAYIFNTPRTYLAVGDILKLDNNMFVVLSPTCDLIIRPDGGAKAEDVLLIYCHNFETFVLGKQAILDQIQVIKDPANNENKKDKAKKYLEKLMRQDWENPSGRYFYLPPFGDFPGGVIDFLKAKIEPYNANTLVEKRIVSLNRELAAELTTRFGRHMIRLGQPAYDPQFLIKAVCNAIS